MGRENDKYRRILEAATKTFAQNGYYSSRVADIAKEAGVASGTIYLYFNRKEDLIISIFHRAVEDLIHHLLKYEDQDPADISLKVLVQEHLLRMEEDHNRARVFQIELRQANSYIREGIGTPLKGYFYLLESIVERGREEGIFRKDVETRLMRKMIFGTLDEICTRWVLSGCSYSLTEMVPSLMRLFMAALKVVERTESKEV